MSKRYNSKCSRCTKVKAVAFDWKVTTIKGTTELILCGKCLRALVLNIFTWNPDIVSKAFTYVDKVKTYVESLHYVKNNLSNEDKG